MTGKHPGLRHHTRRRKSGKVVTYYFYDRRAQGLPDEPLGTDYDEAVKRWAEIHTEAPRIAGTLEEALKVWERDALPGFTGETRKGYTKNLRRLRPVFGPATWDAITLVDLRAYLKARKGKTQANREVSLLGSIWNWARLEGYTDLPWPAAGLNRAKWKNPERARQVVPADAVVAAIYAEGDQVLRDCMDLAGATGMRLTDCRTIVLPAGDLLRLKASKTGKTADFDLSLSAVLPALVTRRRALKADHLMLLSTPAGRKVSAGMLRDRFDAAREAAAVKAESDDQPDMAAAIRAMWLRDMRKVASLRAGSLAAAAELLQHGDSRVTAKHYPGAPPRLKPVG